jgi:hypothetical protein
MDRMVKKNSHLSRSDKHQRQGDCRVESLKILVHLKLLKEISSLLVSPVALNYIMNSFLLNYYPKL